MHEIYLRSVCDAGACWETQGCAVTFSKCISTGGRAGCHRPQAPELGGWPRKIKFVCFLFIPSPSGFTTVLPPRS